MNVLHLALLNNNEVLADWVYSKCNKISSASLSDDNILHILADCAQYFDVKPFYKLFVKHNKKMLLKFTNEECDDGFSPFIHHFNEI